MSPQMSFSIVANKFLHVLKRSTEQCSSSWLLDTWPSLNSNNAYAFPKKNIIGMACHKVKMVGKSTKEGYTG